MGPHPRLLATAILRTLALASRTEAVTARPVVTVTAAASVSGQIDHNVASEERSLLITDCRSTKVQSTMFKS